MKKKTKTNINKTTNRGRPPKKFISKKPEIKRDKPGRPKKHEKVILPLIPEKKDNKTKDMIIRILFVISFLVFGFSVYVSQKENIQWRLSRRDNTTTTQTQIETAEPTQEIITTNNESVQTENTQQNPVEITIEKDEKQILLEQIYQAISSANFDELYKYTDTSLKQSSIFKTYFSRNWLQRFINNIDNQNIAIKIIEINEAESKALYKITYSVKNTQFIEERETKFVTKDNEQKIAKIMCITKWCSTMPFFNPGKYF